MNKTVLLFFTALTFLSAETLSQTTSDVTSNSVNYVGDNTMGELIIAGTSTLHDWESDVTEFSIKSTRDGNIISAELNVVVNSIKSGRPGMDGNTFRAMNESKYPNIIFSAKDLAIEDNQRINGKGSLSIAGVTKSIPILFNVVSWTKGTITVTGEVRINMRDYGIEPPVALFGTVRTGEVIIIKVNTTLKQINN
ncbi:MAG: YceI family protein [Bacteroidia bacterium]|nr:YceI family protein [Bacteroidia bacterium]